MRFEAEMCSEPMPPDHSLLLPAPLEATSLHDADFALAKSQGDSVRCLSHLVTHLNLI